MRCPGIRNSFFLAGIKFSLFLLELLSLLLFHINQARTQQNLHHLLPFRFFHTLPLIFIPLLLPHSFLFAKQFLLCSLRSSPTTNLPSSLQQSTNPSSLHSSTRITKQARALFPLHHLTAPRPPSNNLLTCSTIMFFHQVLQIRFNLPQTSFNSASILLQSRFNSASIMLQATSTCSSL